MIDKEQKIIAFPHASSENAKSVDSTATQTNDPDMTDKIDAAVRDQIKDDEEKLLAIELPTALAEREVKLFFSAILTGLFSIVASITFMSVGFLIFLALATAPRPNFTASRMRSLFIVLCPLFQFCGRGFKRGLSFFGLSYRGINGRK
ncbi:hypothetical protein H6B51_17110 [Pseudoflavonifractor phocaeensis]|nr:hypothetical protein [Pseudoflavonifractor phocaeensis]